MRCIRYVDLSLKHLTLGTNVNKYDLDSDLKI